MEAVSPSSLDVPRAAGECQALNELMGLAVFGEKVAARNYTLMAELSPQHNILLRKFAEMEAKHGGWFLEVCHLHNITPDRDFANRELGYLIDQIEDYHRKQDFEAMLVLQGFIVESLAISTYEPFLDIADRYPGSREAFKKALAEELYHVDWITRYLRLQYFDHEEDFLRLAERVNVQGLDCVGGTMMNIANALTTVGLSGADCAGVMIDSYTCLLENLGIEAKRAEKNVLSIFMPVIRKFRKGVRTK